ncbi:MAG: LysM peptidoglycan-binding domain-containing protein [Desulfovibrio sp.]|nr:LysM peptidoglycan-binding domain-containing protein [Desulfovibrio sp.]
MKKTLFTTFCYQALCLILLLSGCATNRQNGPVLEDITYEPDAKELDLPLKPEEVAALKSTGEIDRNLSSTAMADTTKQFRHYLYGARKHITVSIERARQYLPYVREVFRQRNMPEELAYLGIVESGYRNEVSSHKGAVGVWQFMKTTGARYGLDADSWTDDRMDVYEATEAAAEYLKKLYGEFRDWPTAIAAYNAGEGKIRRAKKECGARNFFEIRERNETLSEQNQLREETKQYVPRFLAVIKIMRNLESLHFTPMTENDGYKVKRLVASKGTDLRQLSEASDLDWNSFCLLNKHHRGLVSSAERDTYVYVPDGKATVAQQFLQTEPRGKFAEWKLTRVTGGRLSWTALEKRYNVQGEILKAANPRCTLANGESILLPCRWTQTADAQPTGRTHRNARSSNQDNANQSKQKGHEQVHVVAENETLYGIAKRYGITPDDIMRVNGISDVTKIRVGKRLNLPRREKKEILTAAAPQNANGSLGKRKTREYVVQQNDSLWKIAKMYNVSVDDLQRWNNAGAKNLRAGTRLIVYAK